MSNIVIDIAAEFTGKKAFKQADSAAAKLNSNVKKLAGAFGIAFSTQALVQFGKTAVKAFAEDEAAATRLARAVDNLGIGFANPAIASYISNLEQSAKIADDVLRPAFQGLLTTTGSLTESQKLLNDAITISRASGIDLATVADDLGKGYIGVTKGLGKYNTGLTKAELGSKSFNEILGVLLKRSAGAAEDYLGTTAYQLDAISVSASTASEIIGQGLVDSLLILSGNTTASDLADDMITAAENTAEFSKNIAQVIRTLNTPLDFAAKGLAWFVEKTQPLADLLIEGDPSGFMKKTSKAVSSMSGATAGFNGKTFYADAQKNADALAKAENEARKRAALLLKIKNQQLENEKKQLAAKKLAAAIDKANLALGKGEGIFDLDKIQVAAALANQAKLLGETTNSAQQMQIANDVARLNVKKSILELEDAIASKDEQAIIAATAKLNADLKVLNALSGQNAKLVDIKSVLDSLKPVDLVNQSNLDKALATIQEMLRLLAQANTAATAKVPTSGTLGSGIPVGDYIAPISKAVAAQGSIDAILEYAQAAAARANAFADLLDMDTAAQTAALQASSLYSNSGALQSFRESETKAATVNIYANTVANPEELITLVQDSLIKLNRRGDALTQAGTL